jgi:small conductance mechanosensitive channel
VDFQRAWHTMLDMVNGTIASLPNLVLGILIFIAFYVVGKRTNIIVCAMTDKRQKARHAGIILGKLAQSGVITTGILVVLTVVFPSFRPGDLIQLLGIGSVAIGFAFHDIFQNFLAGILLLLTGPFRVGDEIAVDQYEGKVEDIQTRATSLRTYDGRRIVIPNSDLFTNSVTVYTAFPTRQIHYDLTIDFNEDIAHAKRSLLEALNTVHGVMQEPKAGVLVTSLTDSGIVLHISCWTKYQRKADILLLQDNVLTTIKDMLIAKDIHLPTQTQKIFLESVSSHQNGAHAEPAPQIEEVNL